MTDLFAPNDPRRAASLDALGTLAAAQDDRDGAVAFYGKAHHAWQTANDWVGVMGTAQAARSSMFHLRLESKHPGAYPEITRARHHKTAAAGRAGCAANLAMLRDDQDGLSDAMIARRDAFGLRESGAAAMAAALGEPVDADALDRWTARPPQRFDDERRLYAAALLAPVLATTDDATMKITAIRATPVNLPLEAPYIWALGEHPGFSKTIVEVETDRGS